LKRVPRSSEWEKFRLYAKRIRELYLSDSGRGGIINVNVYSIMSLHRPDLFLLPNLCKLEWHDTRLGVVEYVRLFLGPSITKLDFPANINHDAALSIYPMLMDVATNLRHITLYSTGGTNDGLISNVVAKPHLTTVNVLHCFLNARSLQTLSASTELRDLGCSLDGTVNNTLARLAKARSFAGLQSLWVKTGLEVSLNALLNAISSATCKSLAFMIMDHCSSEDLSSFSCTLVTRPFENSLTNLSIGFEFEEHKPNINVAEYEINLNTLHPLFVLPHIERFCIASPFLALDDSFLAKVAESWPSLETLSLIHSSRGAVVVPGPKPYFNIRSLLALDTLQHLQEIDIRLANPGRRPFGEMDMLMPDNAIEVLCLRDTPLEEQDAPRVAAQMSLILPRLKLVTSRYSGPKRKDVQAARRQVSKLIPFFRVVQVQERLWALKKYQTATQPTGSDLSPTLFLVLISHLAAT
jgi:hypothetical protein